MGSIKSEHKQLLLEVTYTGLHMYRVLCICLENVHVRLLWAKSDYKFTADGMHRLYKYKSILKR